MVWQSLAGLVVFVVLAWAIGENRRVVRWKTIMIGAESALCNNLRFRYNAVNFMTSFSKELTQDTTLQESD